MKLLFFNNIYIYACSKCLHTWYFRLLCSMEPEAAGNGRVWGLEKVRGPKLISPPSLSLSLLFHPSASPSDTAPSSSPSNAKASSILNWVAMAIASYTPKSWGLMHTVGEKRVHVLTYMEPIWTFYGILKTHIALMSTGLVQVCHTNIARVKRLIKWTLFRFLWWNLWLFFTLDTTL